MSKEEINEKFKFSAEKPDNYDLSYLKQYFINKTNQILEVEQFDEEKYFDKILLAIKKHLNDTNTNKKESHQSFIYDLGEINDSLDLPEEYKYLVTETRDVIREVKKGKGNFNVGLNSYLVPGSLSSLNKILDYKLVDSKNISINLSHGVNIQEGCRFAKHLKNSDNDSDITYFEEAKDIIENIKIELGDDSSIAHGVIFQSKHSDTNIYEYNLKTGKNVFVGINCQLGSGIELGDNSALWFGTVIEDDVKIGNNVVIGEGCKIKKGIKIPDNCLVPNGAIIREDSQIVEYSDYIKNEVNYDTQKLGKRGRRSFIIKLNDDSNTREEELKSINEDYHYMSEFNKDDVTPENKAFAVMNTILAIINEKFPELKIIQELRFKSSLNNEDIDSNEKISNEEKFILNNELENDIILTLKAFPKNQEKFLKKVVPQFIEAVRKNENTDELKNIIKGELDFPEIPENKEKVFLGNNIITGRCNIDNTSLVYDSYIRSDELGKNDIVEIKGSVLMKTILHGGGDKRVNNSKVTGTVIHGKTSFYSSKIGNMKFPSVYHNCKIKNVIQLEGGVNAVGANVEDSILGDNIILMPGSNINKSKIGDYAVIGKRKLKKCIIQDNSHIGNGEEIKGQFIQGKLYSIKKDRNTGAIL